MAYKGWYFHFIEDWSQLFGGCNWYTFRPIMMELEWDRIMGGIEATVILLGLGFRVRHNYTETDQVKDIQEQIETIMKEHPELKKHP